MYNNDTASKSSIAIALPWLIVCRSFGVKVPIVYHMS